MNKITTYAKAHKVLVSIGALILLIGGYYSYKSYSTASAQTSYVLGTVRRGTIVVSVTGSGQVATVNKIALKPQSSGTVTAVRVQNGEFVKKGQVVAMVDERSALLSIEQAKAGVESAQANYDKVAAGTATADITMARLSVQSAQNSLDNAKRTLAQVTAQQVIAVKNSLASLLSTGLVAVPTNGSSPAVSITGSYSGSAQGAYTISIVSTGAGLYYDVEGLESTYAPIIYGQALPVGTRGLFVTFSATLTYAPGSSWTIQIPNVQTSTYSGNLNDYQAALQSQSQALANAQATINSSQLSLDQANATLASKQAPALPQDVANALAQLHNAQAQLQSAYDTYSNNIVTAPFDGQIGGLTVQVGDQASSGTAVATLLTKDKVAQLSVNEIDAAKLKVGDAATLTFDAVSDLSIPAHVADIDPLGTVSQGVVSYAVKVAFDAQDDRIQPGMSVSASIVTATKDNVLIVPTTAIKSAAGGRQYVQELADAPAGAAAGANANGFGTSTFAGGTGFRGRNASSTRQNGSSTRGAFAGAGGAAAASAGVTSASAPVSVVVETGLSNDTQTEVTSGLKEGDRVVVRTITTTAAKTAASATPTLFGAVGAGGGAAAGGARAGGGTFRGGTAGAGAAAGR